MNYKEIILRQKLIAMYLLTHNDDYLEMIKMVDGVQSLEKAINWMCEGE